MKELLKSKLKHLPEKQSSEIMKLYPPIEDMSSEDVERAIDYVEKTIGNNLKELYGN